MSDPLIALVGVCAAGKSTLAAALRDRGYNARQVSQEHSYVSDLYRRFTHADLVIYLDASLDTIRARLEDSTWPEWLLEAQRKRLARARRECNFYLTTDQLSRQEVADEVTRALSALIPSVDPSVPGRKRGARLSRASRSDPE